MTIHFHCACGQKLKASEASVGKHFDCPVCGAEVTVPEKDESKPVAAAVAEVAAVADEIGATTTEPEPAPPVRIHAESDDDDAGVVLAASDTAEYAMSDTKELEIAQGRDVRRKAKPIPLAKDWEPPSAEGPDPEPPPARETGPRPRHEPGPRRDYMDPTDGATARNGTSGAARDLVKLVREIKKEDRSAEDRKKADKRRKKEDGDRLDWGALAAELGTTVLPAGLGIVLLCFLSYWLASSVMAGGSGRPELGDVSGVIKLDGAPLPGANVTFQPVAAEGPEGESHISASVGTTDTEGRYALTYVQDVAGAAVGPHKVMINAALPNGRERIPMRYNADTELTFDVKSGSNDDADFDLKSK